MVAAIEVRAAALDAPIRLAMGRQKSGVIAHNRGDLRDARERLEGAY
jgi:hypothetical protein